jgi:hypothetical protein
MPLKVLTTVLAVVLHGGGGWVGVRPALCENNLRLELLQFGLQLSQFGICIFDEVRDFGETLAVLGHLAQLLGALLDLQLFADFPADGLFDFLQRDAGGVLAGRVARARHAVFISQLIQFWLPNKVALKHRCQFLFICVKSLEQAEIFKTKIADKYNFQGHLPFGNLKLVLFARRRPV